MLKRLRGLINRELDIVSLTTDASVKQPALKVYSPEESYRVLPVLYRRSWTTPIVFGGIVLWTLSYLIFGEIDLTAKGNAILLTPEAVVPFQSLATGQIGKWNVKVGDRVQKGHLLAIVEQPLIEKELAQARQQLDDIRERNQVIRSLTETHLRLEKAAIVRKRKMLADRMAILKLQTAQSKGLTKDNAAENLRSLTQQQQNLQGLLDLEKKRLEELQQELARTEKLRAERLRSADEVVSARQVYGDQVQRVLDLELQLTQLNLTRIRADETELQSYNRITEQEDSVADLNEQMEGLANQEIQLEKAGAEAFSSQLLQVSELERMVGQLQKQLAENREIRSEHSGRILELTTGEGKLIMRGQRLGSIDTGKESRTLQAVAYFKVQDGKRIKPGSTLLLTPATVTRERFGSAIAHVTTVSRFPVSTEGAAKIVGNATLARTLTQDGYQIEVLAELVADPGSPSGYKWDSSAGPEIELTSGTIASVLAKIETRAPITFILPILR